MLSCLQNEVDVKGTINSATHRASPRLAAQLLAAVLGVLVIAGAVGGADANPWLRVCADPDNMPFSNRDGAGFENKLAELIAEKLGAKLDYTWIAEGRGLVRDSRGAASCDLVMGYAQGTGLVEDTNPYYHTTYVLIYRADNADLKGVNTLTDARLKNKRIGLFARTPPASMLAMNGLVASAKPFEPGDHGSTDAADAMISELASGKIDAALLWGPVGGFSAQRSDVPLTIAPLVKEQAGPSPIHGITMGVRPNEPEWKHKINKVIADNQAEINAILLAYNVPLLDAQGRLIEVRPPER